jgi:hypothetical protein
LLAGGDRQHAGELTLNKLVFTGGRAGDFGNGPAIRMRITDYWQALRRKVVGGTNLFTDVNFV